MRKRFRFVSLVLLVFLFALIIVIGFGPNEPFFQGKPFSDWIWTMNESPEGPRKDAARVAVRTLGVHSVPLLLRWLREEDHPSFVGLFNQWREGAYFWLVGHRVLPSGSIRSLPDKNRSHQAMAMWALPELQPEQQRAAIPILIQMLAEKSARPDETAVNAGIAWCVLSKMDPEAIHPLMDALSSRDYQTWALAAGALGNMGAHAKPAVALIESRLNDKDANIRLSAAYNLGKIGVDPAKFMPVVIATLPDLDRDSLDFKLEILLRYKAYATDAIPVLVEISNKLVVSTNLEDVALLGSVKDALQKMADEPKAK